MPLEICPSSNDICESFLVVCHLLLLLNICDDVQHIFWKMPFNNLEHVHNVVCKNIKMDIFLCTSNGMYSKRKL